MTSAEIPTTPRELTAPWLTSALRKAGHLRAGAVEHLRAESLDATKAAYGTLVRLFLTYSGASDLPPTMIVKLPSSNPAAAAIMRASGGYRTEVRFYQQAGSAIGVRVPACYGAFFDDTTSNFLLLLEDLSQHRSADRAGDLSLRETTAV